MSQKQLDGFVKIAASGARGSTVKKKMMEELGEQDHQVMQLLRAFKCTASRVPASPQSFLSLRSRALSMQLLYGCYTFFITINPSALSCSLAMEMAGQTIEVEDGLQQNNPSLFEKWKTVAANPVMQGQYYDMVVEQFMETFLGWAVSCDVTLGICVLIHNSM